MSNKEDRDVKPGPPREQQAIEQHKRDVEQDGAIPLDPTQLKKAEDEASLDVETTYEVVRREGKHELERTPSGLAWSGLAGGLSMGLSFATQALLRSHLPDAEWRPLIVRFGYSVGFLAVTMGSQQLFTENTLMPVIPLLADRKHRGEIARKTAVLWLVVLLANVLGVFLFALVCAKTSLFSNEVQQSFSAIATEAVAAPAGTIFLRAIAAGWLIALMVWMLPASGDSKVLIVILMTYLVGLGGLAHIVAGTSEVLYLVINGTVSMGTFFFGWFFPALAGNIVGGVTLVAALAHAQADHES